MYIRLETLHDAGVCPIAEAFISATFPHGVNVTEELCIKHANAFSFDWICWAAKNLLPGTQWVDYTLQEAPITAIFGAEVRALLKAHIAAESALMATGGDVVEGLAVLRAGYYQQRDVLESVARCKRAALFGRLAETIED